MPRTARWRGSLLWVGLAVLLATAVRPVPAQIVRQLTDQKTAANGIPTLDDAGTTVYTNTSADPFGSNPEFAWQIAKWDAATGSGSAVTSYADGVASSFPRLPAVSVSDDGLWVAFVSPADLVGQNPDESPELFVMQSDGTGVIQLTDDPGPDSAPVLGVAMAGSANRVLFLSRTDPLGGNPDHLDQLFVINRDGTGLLQLTGASVGILTGFSISDDGTRVAFGARGDPTGGNADGSSEVFAINADGTGLRQLTAAASDDSGWPAIAGDGGKIAFESYADLTGANPSGNGQIFVIDWDGTGLLQLTPGGSSAFDPSITDDGSLVVYRDSFVDATDNPEGNTEIWKVNTDGTGRTVLTNTTTAFVNWQPVVAGGGGRIAFFSRGGEFPGGNNPDGGPELMVMDATGGNLLQLTANAETLPSIAPDITPDGSRIVFLRWDVYRIQADGSDLVQVTSLTDAPAESPGVSSDGGTIVFDSQANPAGQNNDNEFQIFAVNADGTNVRQLTPPQAVSCSVARHPVIAADGSWVVFQSCNNYDGFRNIDLSAELFRVAPDGSGLTQVTDDDDSLFKWPRVDDSGVWVVYQSQANIGGMNPNNQTQVFRIRSDGTGFQQLTTDPNHGAATPDISGNGTRIVYGSSADPLGTNGDHSWEIFLWQSSTGTTTQLTFTTEGGSDEPRISRDGAWVYFKSDAPFFEPNTTGVFDAYRVEVATGIVERAGALRRWPSDLRTLGAFRNRYWHVAPDADGSRAVFGAVGDWVGQNPDLDREVYLIDQDEPARLVADKGSTIVSWDARPRALRHDVIRGDIANLAPGPGNTVDLGPVVCLEDDSPDAEAIDAVDPAPGQALFYLERGSQGANVAADSYGFASNGDERLAGSGDCQP